MKHAFTMSEKLLLQLHTNRSIDCPMIKKQTVLGKCSGCIKRENISYNKDTDKYSCKYNVEKEI